jgi:hypothetical protein
VSVCAFKFIKRHVHPPVLAIHPSIWYWILSLWILTFQMQTYSFYPFCQGKSSYEFRRQPITYIISRNCGMAAKLKYCLTGLSMAI